MSLYTWKVAGKIEVTDLFSNGVRNVKNFPLTTKKNYLSIPNFKYPNLN